MVPRGFPPNESQELIFQTSAQSDKAIQSYPSANEGCRKGVLIVAKVCNQYGGVQEMQHFP